MKKYGWFLLMSVLLISIQTAYAGDEHGHSANTRPTTIANQQKDKHGEEGLIEISPEGQQAAGIKTEILKAKSLPIYISAPGEAIPNKDLTAIVTPRIQAQVIQRLVKIGDHVKQGQPLVRLSSVAMARAQAELIVAYKEWKRAKKIKQEVIVQKYYHEADINYQQKYSKLISYGMTKSQIDRFLELNDPSKADGVFTLLSPRGGTVFTADFTEGEMIPPGKVLYTIVNESSLWVDAKLSAGKPIKFAEGARAIIQTNHHKLEARVLQVHHKLDETTRTRVVRLDVANSKDQLHPGEFVTCRIQTGETQPVLAVHQTTLMRTPDGDQAIYVEVKANHFKAQEVEVIKKIGPWRVIKGIQPDVRIVTKGAFFVHSESLKSGFSRHNH